MARDNSKQFLWTLGGGRVDLGEVAFTTTGESVEVTTRFTKIYSVEVTTVTDVGRLLRETYFCDKVVTGGAVTLERRVKPFTISALGDDAVHVSTYAWASVPVGYSPVAGAINGLRFYQKTASGDAAGVVLLGKVNKSVSLIDDAGAVGTFVVGEEVAQATSLTRGVVLSWNGTTTLLVRTLDGTWTDAEITGGTSGATMTPETAKTVPSAEDASFFIDAGNAWKEPEAAHFLDIQSGDITVGDSADEFTSTTVAAGDMITFGTNGAGSSAPSGLRVEVDILPTLYSGTEISYVLFGR